MKSLSPGLLSQKAKDFNNFLVGKNLSKLTVTVIATKLKMTVGSPSSIPLFLWILGVT